MTFDLSLITNVAIGVTIGGVIYVWIVVAWSNHQANKYQSKHQRK